MPTTTSTSATAKFPRQRIRLPHPRTKTGCIPCREKHKKCGEERPACARCETRNVACRWPAATNQNRKGGRSSASGSPSPVARGDTQDQDTQSLLHHTDSLDVDLGLYLEGSPPLERGLDPMQLAVGNLGSSSSLFLHHYFTHTCHRITTASPNNNPYLTHLLPLAATDDLVLQALVTLGGVHLAHKNPSPDVTLGAWQHYGKLIGELRELTARDPPGFDELLRVLLLQVLFCVIEAFTNNRTGAAYFHLRAIRRLIPNLLSHNVVLEDPQTRVICGVILEVYAYHALVTVSTPYREFTPIDFDPRDDTFLQSLDILQQFETFGIVLGVICPLLQYIPRIAQLAQQRQQESWKDSESSITVDQFNALYQEIETLQISLDTMLRFVDQAAESLILAQIYRHALLISLIDAMWGGVLFDKPEMLAKLRSHAAAAFKLLPSMADSRLSHIIGWSLVVIGSCLETEEQRSRFGTSLEHGSDVGVFQNIREVLEILWKEGTPGYFGPYGLYQVMASRSIVLCVG